MGDYDRTAVRDSIKRHEGFRGRPYDDATGSEVHAPVGRTTIGYGWNLDTKPIPTDIADLLLDRSIDDAITAISGLEPRWLELDPQRRDVLVEMAFNLGPLGLARFTKFRRAIRDAIYGGDPTAFGRAADEMKASQWHIQVGERAVELEAMMRGTA